MPAPGREGVRPGSSWLALRVHKLTAPAKPQRAAAVVDTCTGGTVREAAEDPGPRTVARSTPSLWWRLVDQFTLRPHSSLINGKLQLTVQLSGSRSRVFWFLQHPSQVRVASSSVSPRARENAEFIIFLIPSILRPFVTQGLDLSVANTWDR